MDRRDEELRNAVTDAFTAAGIDARNLAVEAVAGDLIVAGTVPTEEQRRNVAAILAESIEGSNARAACHVAVRAAGAPDSPDGRGRSPVTGTSADSAHESRHQTDDQ